MMPGELGQLWRDLLQESRSPLSRRAMFGGALALMLLEVLASFARATFLPHTPFFEDQGLWLSLAALKGLAFGPLLGLVTRRAYRLWRMRRWEDTCHICLRAGFILSLTQGVFAIVCFLAHPYFPFLTWLAASWPHFALWLTLNVSFIWALLLLVAGFLLPSDAHKTIQIDEKVSF